MLFAEERMPVVFIFTFFASLLHVLFPATCCTRLKAYGRAVRGVEISQVSSPGGCHSECRQRPVQWDCRAGLGLTLWHQGLKEMLEVATLAEAIFTRLI